MTEAFKASLSALYARRAVAAEFACRGMLNPHTDSSEQWLLHDELFYKYAFDVPVPHFNSNANRAAFRRIIESDLPRADRVEHDVWLTWHRHACVRHHMRVSLDDLLLWQPLLHNDPEVR